MAEKRKRLKLTKEQKRLIHAQPTENAGAGWNSEHTNNVNPRVLERGDGED